MAFITHAVLTLLRTNFISECLTSLCLTVMLPSPAKDIHVLIPGLDCGVTRQRGMRAADGIEVLHQLILR